MKTKVTSFKLTNSIHGIAVVFGRDPDTTDNGRRKEIHTSMGVRPTCFPRDRKRYDLQGGSNMTGTICV